MKKHKIKINISDRNGDKCEILRGEYRYIPKRLLNLLFGDFCEVFVFQPGKTVEGVMIQEVRGDDND